MLTLDVGSTVPRASLRSVAPLHTPLRWGVAFLRATAGKRPFRSFSFSAFLVHFVNTKKIETGQKSCLYFLGPSRRQRSCSNGFATGKNASLSCERSGLAAAGGRALKTTIQVVFATDSLMLSLAILLPGCSRPTTRNKKLRVGINPTLNSLAPQVGLEPTTS